MLCVNNEVLTFNSLLAKHQHVSPVQLNNNRQVNGTIVTLKVTDCLEWINTDHSRQSDAISITSNGSHRKHSSKLKLVVLLV